MGSVAETVPDGRCAHCGALPTHQNPNARALTPRELEIIKQTANGLSNIEIAVLLGLSQFTVKNHLARIAKVLGTGDRAGMVGLALREGMIT